MSKVGGFVYLSAIDVSKYLPSVAELYTVLKSTMLAYSTSGSIVQPVRSQLNLPNSAGRFITMPAVVEDLDLMGLKVVSAIPGNTKLNLPTHLGSIQLYRLTGELVCQMDAGEITAKRTAAASAVATKVLANPNSTTLAILGSGVQARSHIEALTELYNFEEIRIWSRTNSRAVELVEELGGCTPATACSDIKEACRGADIICTVTGSHEPLLFNDHVKPGAHINVVGASSPTTREISDDLMLSGNLTLVCDCALAVVVESGDVVQTGAKVNCEIGELLSTGFSRTEEGVTLYKNLGLACQDIACGNLVYQNYLKTLGS